MLIVMAPPEWPNSGKRGRENKKKIILVIATQTQAKAEILKEKNKV
jgi:hypothetical protein